MGAIREAGRETTTVVVFTNGDAIKSVKLEQTGSLAAKTAVAKVELEYLGGWKLFPTSCLIGEKHEVFNTQYP